MNRITKQILDLRLDGHSRWDIVGILDIDVSVVCEAFDDWENMTDDERETFKANRAFFG